LLLHLERGLLRDHGQFRPSAKQAKIAPMKLAGGAARHEVDEGLFLKLAQASWRPQMATKRGDFRGFVRWPTHPWNPKTASFDRF
jgi:hypothetical protein